MHQTLNKLYAVQLRFQTNLFPHIKQELGHLTQLQQKFIQVLDISQIDSFVRYVGNRACRPMLSCMALARCFIAKAVYNMPTTQVIDGKVNIQALDRTQPGLPIKPGRWGQ